MSIQARADMELWDRPFQSLLLGVLAINIAAHITNIPIWTLIASIAALIWKLGHLYRGIKLPPRWTLFLAGAAASVGIVIEYDTLFGYEAATPLLVFLASLKTLETNKDRDAMFIIVTSYFLLMAHLLHSQSLGSTMFMAFDVAAITILMFQLHRTDRRLTRVNLRPITRILLLTVPVWLFLFMVFPRFSLRLMQSQSTAPSVGFSEGLNPTSISSLIESDEIAFRVRFLSSAKRSIEAMYWRGAVLYRGKDLRWQPEEESLLKAKGHALESRPAEAPKTNETTDYEVTLEPSAGRTLFTLPRLISLEGPVSTMSFKPYMTEANLGRLTTERRDRLLYRAQSILEEFGPLENLSLAERSRSLLLDADIAPEIQDLAHELGATVQGAPQAVAKIEEWFMLKGFRYSLKLGANSPENMQDFLFKKKVGFCEHFAASSATLLRLMGYPARVAVGFLGGKYNPLSSTFIVRSKDAHAWVEVWYPSRQNSKQGRWITFDPTALIVPLRRQMGGDFFDLSEEQQMQSVSPQDAYAHLSRSTLSSLFDQSVMLWDYAQMSWSNFLLKYDSSGQKEFLDRLLGVQASPGALISLVLLFFVISIRLIVIWRRRQSHLSPIDLQFDKLLREFDRTQIRTKASDGPLTMRSRTNDPDIQFALDRWIDFKYAASTNVSERETHLALRRGVRAASRLPSASDSARSLPSL
ncbi:MAG: DUF3488 domain-containing transglutaminase family protein [Bdellovibrionales bacterium]|nr:DUF3488 domain-containing transglutaminase family protein [Bdellovibrionales bacterium]